MGVGWGVGENTRKSLWWEIERSNTVTESRKRVLSLTHKQKGELEKKKRRWMGEKRFVYVEEKINKCVRHPWFVCSLRNQLISIPCLSSSPGRDPVAVPDVWPATPTPVPWRGAGEHHPPGALCQPAGQVQRHDGEGVQDLQGQHSQALPAHSPAAFHHLLLQGEVVSTKCRQS